MAFHISEYKEWRAGAGTPVKYSCEFDLDCALTNMTQTEATFHLTGKVLITNHPYNSQNSWPASDFAVLTLGGFDPIDYPFTEGTSYYQAALPALPNAPQSYVDALRIEFRGDTYRGGGPNKVSLWSAASGLLLDQASGEGTYTVTINQNFTLQLTGNPQQEVLIYTHSGARNQTGYDWLAHDVWAYLFDFDYRPFAVWNGYNWASCNRSGGMDSVWTGSTWEEMRTEAGGRASDNPPFIYNGSQWVNQNKVGEGG